MIARNQLGNPDALPHENYFGYGIWQLRNELRRSATVSCQPVDYPGVGGVSIGLPRRPFRIRFPMCMGEASGVLVVRIARVRVLKRRLRKGEQQAGRDAEMGQPTYQVTLLYMSKDDRRDCTCQRTTVVPPCACAAMDVRGASPVSCQFAIALFCGPKPV